MILNIPDRAWPAITALASLAWIGLGVVVAGVLVVGSWLGALEIGSLVGRLL